MFPTNKRPHGERSSPAVPAVVARSERLPWPPEPGVPAGHATSVSVCSAACPTNAPFRRSDAQRFARGSGIHSAGTRHLWIHSLDSRILQAISVMHGSRNSGPTCLLAPSAGDRALRKSVAQIILNQPRVLVELFQGRLGIARQIAVVDTSSIGGGPLSNETRTGVESHLTASRA